MLTSEYVKFDLKSAQVAVNSKSFDLPDVQEFVKSTPSVWAEFIEVAGIQGTEEIKPCMFGPKCEIFLQAT